MELLDSSGRTAKCLRPDWQPLNPSQIASVHQAEHLATLESLAAAGGGRADPDTVVASKSVEVARLAAGAVCDATRRVLAGEARNALCLVRPPGHHALAQHAMGFCLLNNVALAAQSALDLGVERVMIVDWDVHHGNGTQAIFYNDPRVGYFSVHRWPFYPGTGSCEESGTGDGTGATRNLPLPFGTPRRDFQDAVLRELVDFSERTRPELVLVSAGFDAHRADPIGSLGLEFEDFSSLSKVVLQIADSYSAGRVVSALEGGYNPPVLAKCVAEHLDSFLENDH